MGDVRKIQDIVFRIFNRISGHLDRVIMQVKAKLNPLVESDLWLSAIGMRVTLMQIIFLVEDIVICWIKTWCCKNR